MSDSYYEKIFAEGKDSDDLDLATLQSLDGTFDKSEEDTVSLTMEDAETHALPAECVNENVILDGYPLLGNSEFMHTFDKCNLIHCFDS